MTRPPLVRDNTTGVWHSADDDGLRVEKLNDTSLSNGDNDGEYWKVTDQDGTQYFFGRNRRFAGDTAVTNSVLTEPVFGNNAGEPCNNAAGFGSSWCQQAYRWNLDYVVDTHGNSMTYSWSKFSGKYGLNNNASAQPYDLSAALHHIDYGTRAGSEGSGSAPVRVAFAVENRCIGACAHADFPDTPWDRYCDVVATTCPGLLSPNYFTPYRLSSVTTQVWNSGAAAFRNVDRWNLDHTYPTSGDNINPVGADTNPNLWLNNLTHVGYAANGVTTQAEPTVHFAGTPMANRVDWGNSLGVAPYMHYRLTTIVNGTGGQTVIAYSPVERPNGAPKQNSDANPYRCFPQYSKPIAAPSGFVWFNKFVVNSVTEQDLTGGGPDEVWTYAYSTAGTTDNSLWAHDVNEIAPIFTTSWGQWRGYSTVTATHGAAGGPQTVSRTLYFRGMQWDAKKSGDDSQVLFGVRPAATTAVLESGGGIQHAIAGGAATCLDVEFSGTTNGNPIKSYPCNNQPNQVWQRQSDDTLKNPASGRCLDIADFGTTNGALVQLWDCNATSNQIWLRQPNGSLKNPASGRCLDIADYATGANGVVKLYDCLPTGYNQVWQQVNTGALTNPHADRCIDILNGGPGNATKVQNWTCNSGDGQEWVLQPGGTIRNPASGRCLDITNFSTAEGAPVQLYDCSGGPNQLWAAQFDGTLKNPASGRCLDAGGANAVLGAQLAIRTCSTTPGQQWVSRVLDTDGLQGVSREETTLDGATVLSSTVHVPTIGQTATRSAPAVGGQELHAYLVREATAATRTWIAATSAWRWPRTDTTYDGLGLLTDTHDYGDTAVPDDDTCTHLDYARNTTAYIVATVSQSKTTDCAASPGPANYLAGSQAVYDNTPNVGDPPTQGLMTKTLSLASFTGNTAVWAQAGRTAYDTYGRAADTYDALDRHTTSAYSPATGGPITQLTVTNAAGHVTTTQVDPGKGFATRVTDPNLKVTTATYDPLGRLTQVFLPRSAGSATDLPDLEYNYTVQSTGPNVTATKQLGPNGNQIQTFQLFDGRLRPRQKQIPAPQANGGRNITDTTYDSRGLGAQTSIFWNSGVPSGVLVAFANNAVQNQHRYTYDRLERQTTDALFAGDALKWQATTGFDGDRTWTVPPAGGTATMALTDARDNTIALRQYLTGAPPNGGTFQTTAYTYDRLNRVTGTTDPVGSQWSASYDLRGRVVSATDPDKGTMQSTYDDAGQLIKTIDARNVTLSYAYDSLGRKTGLFDGPTISGFKRASWIYDTITKGQLTSSSRYYNATDTYTSAVTGYNDQYQPTGASVTIPPVAGQPAGTYTVHTAYNVDGSIANNDFPSAGGLSAETVTNTYDDTGSLLTVASQEAYVSDTSYYNFGTMYQRILGTGDKRVRQTTAVDEATGRLTQSTTETQNQTVPANWDEKLTKNYSYNPSGNVTGINETSGGASISNQCFRYDPLEQLTEAWTTTNPTCQSTPSQTAVGGPDPYWTSYTYNSAGSRTTEVKHAAPGDTTRTYAYPSTGRRHTLTGVTTTDASTGTDSYAYDASGNTTTRAVAGAPNQTLAWDNEGHLGSVTDSGGTTRYIYDADGNRLMTIEPSGVTTYLPGFELRTVSGVTTCTRYYGDIAARTPTGLTWLANDAHGTNELAIDAATLAATRRRFDPFGNPRGAAPTWPTAKGFVNGTRDGTGLTHLGAREYEPGAGRFISGDPLVDLADPQTMGGYAYARNNPVTSTDSSGTCADCASSRQAIKKKTTKKPVLTAAAIGKAAPILAPVLAKLRSQNTPVKPKPRTSVTDVRPNSEASPRQDHDDYQPRTWRGGDGPGGIEAGLVMQLYNAAMTHFCAYGAMICALYHHYLDTTGSTFYVSVVRLLDDPVFAAAVNQELHYLMDSAVQACRSGGSGSCSIDVDSRWWVARLDKSPDPQLHYGLGQIRFQIHGSLDIFYSAEGAPAHVSGSLSLDIHKDWNFDTNDPGWGGYLTAIFSQMPSMGLAREFVVTGSTTLPIDKLGSR